MQELGFHRRSSWMSVGGKPRPGVAPMAMSSSRGLGLIRALETGALLRGRTLSVPLTRQTVLSGESPTFGTCGGDAENGFA